MAEGGDLGTARGKIIIDSSEAVKGVQQADKALTDLQKRQQAAADHLKDVGASAAKLYAGAVVGGFALAINSAKDFEQALANVKAAGGKDAADQMDLIRKKAMQLGADTKYSATEAANAMEALVKAGLSVTEVLNGGADAAVNLAAAEGIDLTQAAEIAATAMTAFNLKASDLPGIANKISQAASATKMDVTDFAQAMNQAGAVSKLVGLSFEDMALGITAMGKAGIVGSDAGTSLKTMLLNLQPATGPAREAMRELGLLAEDGSNAFFDAAGNVKSMSEISNILYTSTKNLNSAQKQQALETIFGSDAIRAAAVITEKGADSMAGLTAEMTNQLSVAEKAKIKQDTLSGAIEKMKGSIDTAAIQLGTALIPVIRQLAEGIEKAADWFSKLSPEVQQAIIWFALGSVAALTLGWGLLKAITIVRELWTVLRLGAAIKAFGTGMSTVAAAARMTFMQVGQGAATMGTAVANGTRAAAAGVAAAGRAVLAGAVATGQAIAAASAQAAAAAGAAIRAGAQMAASAAATAARTVAAWALMGAQAAAAGARMVAAAAVQVAGWVRMAVVAMANALIMAAAWLIANPWLLIAAAIIALVVLIVANWDKIKEFLIGVWNAIKDWAISIWNSIVQGLATAWQWVKDTAASIWNSIADFFMEYWPYILGIFTGGIGLIVGLIIQNWDSVKQFCIDVWNSILDFLSGLWQGIVNTAMSLWNTITSVIREGITTAKDTVVRVGTGIVDFFRELPGKIISFLSGLPGMLLDVGRNMMQGLINGVKAVANNIKDAVLGPIKDSVAAVKNFLGISSPAKLTYEIGDNFGQGYVLGVDANTDAARKAIQEMSTGGVNLSGPTSPLATGAASALGVGQGTPLAAERSVGRGGTTITIGELTIPINATLDPTNRTQWRAAMGAIKDGIADYERSFR